MDGIMIVHKEKGYTSHDVVAKLRGILKQRKIGHTGTLDPDATGVLPVCLGNATRVVELLENETKTYQCVCRLGIVTDTQDMSGNILKRQPVLVTKESIMEAVENLEGELEQVPPMYSALKVNGKKLYELAREGKEVERKARRIHIYEPKILDFDLANDCFSMEITCSKGTYIRTICNDLGETLGCGACMQSLVRTRVGRFSLTQAKTLKEIEEQRDHGEVLELLLSVDSLFMDYPQASTVDALAEKLLYNGNKLTDDSICLWNDTNELIANQRFRVYDSSRRFQAIYERKADGIWMPVKMFLSGR